MSATSGRRVGLWMIGAYGGVATTITVGLAAIAKGLRDRTALVSELPAFRGLGCPDPADFVIGGHEIRAGSFERSANEFHAGSGVFGPDLVAACRDELAAATARVRPGTARNAGAAIARLSDWAPDEADRPLAAVVERLAADLDEFASRHRLDHVVVLNVSSTEPPVPAPSSFDSWDRLNAALSTRGAPPLPPSALYALAAFRGGHSYVNFTPSLGASFPAAYQLAESTGALHAGKDGKTGETLMKTVLAPMFVHRNLSVMSWVGHNIFGNRDAVVLDDPENKAAKVGSKDQVVHQILGYKPTTLVTIENIPDMGDWKTAWDHIHFRGFLGTPMTLQFIWQGCDSLLAAPLAIDLARLTDAAKRRGETGLLRALAPFFKSPEGVEENDFFKQTTRLEQWAQAPTRTP